MKNEIPRRNRLDLMTPAERAIYDVVHVVEGAGAHPLLTEAVVLLGKAREKVADFVDGPTAQPEPRAAGTQPERTWQETPELLRICGGCKDPTHDCHLNAGSRERIARLRAYMAATTESSHDDGKAGT